MMETAVSLLRTLWGKDFAYKLALPEFTFEMKCTRHDKDK